MILFLFAASSSHFSHLTSSSTSISTTSHDVTFRAPPIAPPHSEPGSFSRLNPFPIPELEKPYGIAPYQDSETKQEKRMTFESVSEILFRDSEDHTYSDLSELRDLGIYPTKFFAYRTYEDTLYSRAMSVLRLYNLKNWTTLLDSDNFYHDFHHMYGTERTFFSYVNEMCGIDNDLVDQGFSYRRMRGKEWSHHVSLLKKCLDAYKLGVIYINGSVKTEGRKVDTLVLISPTEAYWTDKYVTNPRDSLYLRKCKNSEDVLKVVYTRKYKSVYFHSNVKTKILVNRQVNKFQQQRLWKQTCKKRSVMRRIQRDHSFEDLSEWCYSHIRKIGESRPRRPHPRNKNRVVSEGDSPIFASFENDLESAGFISLESEIVNETISSEDNESGSYARIQPTSAEEVNFITTLVSTMEEKLSTVFSFVEEHQSLIKFATSTTILVYQLVRSRSFGDYTAALGAYALSNQVSLPTKAMRSYAVEFFNHFKKLFGRVRSEGLAEKFQLFTSRLLHSELIQTLRNLVLSVVSLRFFSKDVAAKITRTIGTPPKMCFADVMESILSNVCTLLTIGDAFVEGRPLYEILTGKNPVLVCIDRIQLLLMYRDKLFAGSKVQGCMSRKEFVRRGEELMHTADVLMREMNPLANSMNILAKLMVDLSHCVATERSVLIGQSRIMPFAIILFGDPGVGKSKIMNTIMRLFAKIKDVQFDESLVYHRVRSSEYWEGYDMLSHLIVHYSEVGNLHKDLVKTKGDEILVELTTIIDTLPAPLNRAFGDKGKVFAIPELIIIDTNNEGLNLDLALCNPAAVKRRFVYIHPTVKPEFRMPGSTALDSEASLRAGGNLLDRWNFEVYTRVPTSNTKTVKKVLMGGNKDNGIIPLLSLLNTLMKNWLDSQDKVKSTVDSDEFFDHLYSKHIETSDDINRRALASICKDLNLDIVANVGTHKVPVYQTSDGLYYLSDGSQVRRKLEGPIYSGVRQKDMAAAYCNRVDDDKESKEDYMTSATEPLGTREAPVTHHDDVSDENRNDATAISATENVSFDEVHDVKCTSEGFLSEDPWFSCGDNLSDDSPDPFSSHPYDNTADDEENKNDFSIMSYFSQWKKSIRDKYRRFKSWSSSGVRRITKAYNSKCYGIAMWTKKLFTYAASISILLPALLLSHLTDYGKTWVKDRIFDYTSRISQLFDFDSTKFVSSNPRIRKIVNICLILGIGVIIKNLINRQFNSEGEKWDSEKIVPVESFEERMDAGASRKRVYNKLDHQIWNTTTSETVKPKHTGGLEDLSTCILKNVYAVAVVKSDKSSEKTNILGIQSNFAIINTHVLNGTSSTFGMCISPSCYLKPETAPLCQEYIIQRHDRIDLGGDITLLKIEGKSFRNILDHISDVIPVRNCFARVGADRTVFQLRNRELLVTNPYADFTLKDYGEYEFKNHRPGMCGSPVICDYEVGQCLVGIHAAGMDKGDQGYCALINKATLIRGITDLNSCSLYPGAVSQGCVFELESPLPKSPVNYLPMHRIEVIGKLEGNTLINKKSKLTKTPFFLEVESLFDNEFSTPFQEFGRPMMKPGTIDGEWISPFNIALDKICSKRADVADDVMNKVIQVLTDRIVQQLPPDLKLAPLTLLTAVNGAKDDIFTRRVNLSTSSGYGMSGIKRDHFLRDEQGIDRPSEELCSRVSLILERFEKGEESGSIYSGQLKDEPRAVEKIRSGKTRLFYMSPLDLLVVQRMLLSPFYTLMLEFGPVFCTAIGVNMHAQAGELRERLLSFSPLILEGDYSNYDQKMPYKVNAAAARVAINVLKKFGYNGYATHMAETCFADSLQPLVEINNDLFRMPGLRCSGKYATAEDNSLCGLILPMLFWYSHPVLRSMYFFDYILPLTYGDDVLMSVKEEVSTHFNALTYRDFILTLEMDFTNPSKKEVDSKFVDVDSCSFLKRTFKYKEDIKQWVAPLDISSVRKSLMWAIKSTNVAYSEQLYGTIQSALYELSFHLERKRFDEFRLQLSNMFKKSFPFMDVTFFTYDDIFSGIFGGDVVPT